MERKPRTRNHSITLRLPTRFASTFHPLSSQHPATNRAEAHLTICPARRFATLRVVVPTLSKAMGVRRLSAHSAYCRPNDSTLLSDRMLRAILQPYIPKGIPLRNGESKCRPIAIMSWLLRLLALGTFTPFFAAESHPPNIVLIVAEDMGLRVGAYGDEVATTPNIDHLANEGVRFTNTFAAAGVCAPNRSALITGVYPQSMGTQQMRTSQMKYEAVPPASVKAFPELLRLVGYATANTTKTDYQFGEPFTIWDADVNKSFTASEDLALWRHLPSVQPFFAMFNLATTHESRLVDASTQPTKGQPWVAPLMKAVLGFRREHIPAITDPNSVTVPPYYPDTADVRGSIAQMYNNIHYVDQQTGTIINNLMEDDLLDNTIILWTTDHGDGFPRAKRSIYDSGIHVPLIIRDPLRMRPGTIDERLVSFVDIAPTILQMAGAPIPSFIQGRSILSDAPRTTVFAGRDRMDETWDWQRAARDKRFKYIRNYRPELAYFRPLAFRDMFPIMRRLWADHRAGTLTPVQARYFSAPRPVNELYDVIADPYEVNNLAESPAHAATLKRLSTAMDEWIERVGDLSQISEEEMIESMWPGRIQPRTGTPSFLATPQGITIHSETEGASLGYQVLPTEQPNHWLIYRDPIVLSPGQTLRAKAIRYGYAESDVAALPSPHPAE